MFSYLVSHLGIAVNFRVLDLHEVQCWSESTIVDSFLLTTFIPLIIMGTLVTFYYLSNFAHRFFIKTGSRRTLVFPYTYLADLAVVIKAFLVILLLVFPSASNLSLQIWHCKNFNSYEYHSGNVTKVSTGYLYSDFRIRCDEEMLQRMIPVFAGTMMISFSTIRYLAAFMIMVYPVGMPVGIGTMLFYHREFLKHGVFNAGFTAGVKVTSRCTDCRGNDTKFCKKCSVKSAEICHGLASLVGAYEQQFMYWECFELLRKVAMVGALAFFMPGTPFQLAFGCLFSVICMSAYAYCRPYRSVEIDHLMSSTQQATFMTFFVGILLCVEDENFKNPDFEKKSGYLLLCTTSYPFVLCLWYQLKRSKKEGILQLITLLLQRRDMRKLFQARMVKEFHYLLNTSESEVREEVVMEINDLDIGFEDDDARELVFAVHRDGETRVSRPVPRFSTGSQQGQSAWKRAPWDQQHPPCFYLHRQNLLSSRVRIEVICGSEIAASHIFTPDELQAAMDRSAENGTLSSALELDFHYASGEILTATMQLSTKPFASVRKQGDGVPMGVSQSEAIGELLRQRAGALSSGVSAQPERAVMLYAKANGRNAHHPLKSIVSTNIVTLGDTVITPYEETE
jgi:hypothetical protein